MGTVMPDDQSTVAILGLAFSQIDPTDLVRLLDQGGGLLVAPSGPGLANLDRDTPYREALESADIVLPDSGFLVMLENLWRNRGDKVRRISGLAFMRAVLDAPPASLADTLWIMPSDAEGSQIAQYLTRFEPFRDQLDWRTAPIYPAGSVRVEDPDLLAHCLERRPAWIFINIGGGVQEKLGHYLKANLDYPARVVCTGAAIAFLSGSQANIPTWADRFYLGWLLRILRDPRKFVPRYVGALRLVRLYIQSLGGV